MARKGIPGSAFVSKDICHSDFAEVERVAGARLDAAVRKIKTSLGDPDTIEPRPPHRRTHGTDPADALLVRHGSWGLRALVRRAVVQRWWRRTRSAGKGSR